MCCTQVQMHKMHTLLPYSYIGLATSFLLHQVNPHALYACLSSLTLLQEENAFPVLVTTIGVHELGARDCSYFCCQSFYPTYFVLEMGKP